MLIDKLKKIWRILWEKPTSPEAPAKKYLTDEDVWRWSRDEKAQVSYERVYQRTAQEHLAPGTTIAQDAGLSPKATYQYYQNTIPPNVLMWYASQSFIGYQTCEIMFQHWLVAKACTMPAEDATRNGYEITANDGKKIPSEAIDAIRKADEKMRINKELCEFSTMNKVFGIRVAMFDIGKTNFDPKYYEKPFNIDSIKPGSYKGIIQIDPYWITPELDNNAASNPASRFFYEPTWWRVNGQRIHRTHLVIIRNGEVGDLLKPTYFYGGVPLPQKLYERVYAAERTANEVPLLVLTKRTDVVSTNTAMMVGKQCEVEARLQQQAFYRDNFATKFLDFDTEKMERFDTSLTDIGTAVDGQYQIVSAIAEVPVNKLMGITLKGFASGEYEENNYHEKLKSEQTHHLSPLLERHHEILIRSEIAPRFGIAPFATTVVWNALDSTTAKGKSENNKLKAEADATYVGAGIISPEEARRRVINDPESGYNGLISEDDELPDPVEVENDPDAPSISSEEEPDDAEIPT